MLFANIEMFIAINKFVSDLFIEINKFYKMFLFIPKGCSIGKHNRPASGLPSGATSALRQT